MRKLMLGLAGVAIFSAVSLASVSPSRAQGSDPKVRITNWGDGYTTMALAFGTIINGMAGGEFVVQFSSNGDSYTSATVRPGSDGVSVMLDSDPPLGPSESVGYNQGVDQLGNNTAVFVFRLLTVQTEPIVVWSSVLVQAYDADDVRQPDLLNRAIADADISESPDTLPSDEAELFAVTLADADWVLNTSTNPLVISGDGASNTIGQLLTFDPITDPPDAAGAAVVSEETDAENAMAAAADAMEAAMEGEDIISGGRLFGAPDDVVAPPAIANASPTMVVTPPADDGSGRVRNVVLGILAALVIASLFTWKIRDKLLERITDPTKPVPSPYYDDLGDDLGECTEQDQPDDPPDDGFVDIKL